MDPIAGSQRTLRLKLMSLPKDGRALIYERVDENKRVTRNLIILFTLLSLPRPPICRSTSGLSPWYLSASPWAS
jgi:hypothetical protein